jgi:DNA-binding transcriptional ArsR family regulator
MVAESAAPVAPVALLDEPDRLRVGLSPIRRRLLERLRQPASATQLASELAMGRQRVNYHLRALEKAKLVDLVEERQRRGCVERILVARAQAFIVDPGVMTAKTGSGGSHSPTTLVSRTAQDRFSAEHLIDTAADVVRDVTRMRAAAEKQGARLLTFAMQTDLSFAEPGDLERFTTAVAEFVAREAAKYHTPGGGRRYRVVIGGHPSPRTDTTGAHKPAAGESHHDRDRDTKEPRDDRPRAGRSARRRTH